MMIQNKKWPIRWKDSWSKGKKHLEQVHFIGSKCKQRTSGL